MVTLSDWKDIHNRYAETGSNGPTAKEKEFAEKIADLESQIESLQVCLDQSQDRVKDLEKDLERQGKRQGAEGQCPMCHSWISKKCNWQSNAVIPTEELKALEQKIEKQDADYEVQYVALTDCLAKIEKLEAVRKAARNIVEHDINKGNYTGLLRDCDELKQALAEVEG